MPQYNFPGYSLKWNNLPTSRSNTVSGYHGGIDYPTACTSSGVVRSAATSLKKSEIHLRLQAALRAIFVLIVLIGFIPSSRAQETVQKIATAGLNEFDLANYCAGLENSHHQGLERTPIPKSRFGYASVGDGQPPEFAYITARYYVERGPYGDPLGCEFKRSLYRLTKAGLFAPQEIDEGRFKLIEDSMRTIARSQKNKSGSDGDLALRDDAGIDAVGGCLFPIYWFKIGGGEYALLSIGTGIVNYVMPHYERSFDGNPSRCFAWGDQHLTNSSIVSSDLGLYPIDLNRIFVESKSFALGFLFQPGLEFQCLVGADALSRHVLISRVFFDSKIRPGLEGLLESSARKSKPARKDGDPNILSFADSVYLNHEFAGFVFELSAQKGCK